MLSSTQLFMLLLMITQNYVFSSIQPKPSVYQGEDDIDKRDLNCAGCLAVVDVIEKHMSKPSSDGVEVRATELMEEICDQKKYPAYDYIPPKMAKVCRQILEEIDDEKLINYVTSHYTNHTKPVSALERAVCLKLTGFCVGSKRIEEQHEKVKHKVKKSKEHVDNDNKKFEANVDDLLKVHGGRLKTPNPVKDEL